MAPAGYPAGEMRPGLFRYRFVRGQDGDKVLPGIIWLVEKAVHLGTFWRAKGCVQVKMCSREQFCVTVGVQYLGTNEVRTLELVWSAVVVFVLTSTQPLAGFSQLLENLSLFLIGCRKSFSRYRSDSRMTALESCGID